MWESFGHFASSVFLLRYNSSASVCLKSPWAHLHVLVTLRFWHKPTELAQSFFLSFFIFCSCVYFSLYGPFNCISFHKFSRQLSVFSLCSCGLSSALLVLSTMYLFMKVSFSPDIIPNGWLDWKHQLTNYLPNLCVNGLRYPISGFSWATKACAFILFPSTKQFFQ